MKTVRIRLGGKRGGYALIDARDQKRVSARRWSQGAAGYAASGGAILLHRFIMRTPKGMDTDHLNHDTLDNRRSNLRIVTRAQNMWNRRGLKKVLRYKKKWRVQFFCNKKRVNVGTFRTKKEALTAYAKAIKKHRKYE